MLKINKKEQSLWSLCSKIEKRTAPSKQEVWMRLEQQLDISSEPKKTSPAIVSNKIKSLFPRLAVALFIMIVFAIPMIKMMNTDNDFLGPINIGNPNEITMNKLASLILSLTNSKSKISYKELPQDDPKRRRPDIKLAKINLGWEPNYSLEDGLSKTINYFKKLNEVN